MKQPILSALVLGTALLSAASTSRTVDEGSKPTRGKALSAALQPFVDRHVLAGAVVTVASKEEVLATEAVGYSDVAAQQGMKPDALFWIASMSKPMTAAGLMMLADEGKVNVDDPVEKYLPEFHGQMWAAERADDHVLLKKPDRPITVKDVLSHTSGLPFRSRVENHIDQRPLREAVVSYSLTPLQTQPGTKYDYSNAGINTAGRIIEVVSGEPYEKFMQDRLFTPLGMKDTTFFPTANQLERLAKSYKPGPDGTGLVETTVDQLTYPLDGPGRFPCPAGGLFSTAADVAAFGQMILSGGTFKGKRYLSEAAVRQMTSTHTGTLIDKTGSGGYGFGLQTSRKAEGDTGPSPAGACGHGGAYATDFWLDPEHGLVLVFMVQHAGFPKPDGNQALPAFRRAAVDAFGK